MNDITETRAAGVALPCPPWCNREHVTDPELIGTGEPHYRPVWEGWLPELRLGRRVVRPDAGAWELFIEKPVDRSRLTTVTLEHSAAGVGRGVAMLPAEARSMAAALVRAADLAELGEAR
jgi:hypothetical protein